jgi:hypothetical protein
VFVYLKIAMNEIHGYTPYGRIAGPSVVTQSLKAFHAVITFEILDRRVDEKPNFKGWRY